MHAALVILTLFLSNPTAHNWMPDATGPRTDISIKTRDSLSLTKGIYSSIFFGAVPANAPEDKMPTQYHLTGSGAPPGMIFEPYPCNKPNTEVCPSLASSDGIFLDGVLTTPGSYEAKITATDASGRKGFARFTITVADSGAH